MGIGGDIARDVNETLAYETETRPRHSVSGPRRDRDQDLPAIPRDRDETETSDFCLETRPRPCKAETETFFETFNLQHCAKTMNGEPASLDITDSSVTATATALFIIMKFIHHISIKHNMTQSITIFKNKNKKTRMWADAQRDGRPAKYR